jgi:hypothetical protein
MTLWRLFGDKLSSDKRNCRQKGAERALQVLMCVNLINYADRFVLPAVKTLIQHDLGLSDVETSLPASGTTLVLTICAFAFGHISDKDLIDRRHILSAAIVVS